MLFKDSALLDRIFRVFDADDDNQISFMEYISCLSLISSKSAKEDKIKCKNSSKSIRLSLLDWRQLIALCWYLLVAFQIYDFDGDNFISSTDLTAVVAATLREHKILIRRADIDLLVQATMDDAHPKYPNMISYEE